LFFAKPHLQTSFPSFGLLFYIWSSLNIVLSGQKAFNSIENPGGSP
jgi:hypothetical protein